MARPNKGYTRRITLRTYELEHHIVKSTQQHLQQSGVELTENDTILFLIQCSTVPPPLTTAAARRAIEMHMETCPDCTAGHPPRCAAGVYLRDCFDRIARAQQRPPEGSPRTVSGRRPLLPPAPGKDPR